MHFFVILLNGHAELLLYAEIYVEYWRLIYSDVKTVYILQ